MKTKAMLIGLFATWTGGGCGPGLPVSVRIDDFTTNFSLNAQLGPILEMYDLDPTMAVWPEELGDVELSFDFTSDPFPIKLIPDQQQQEGKADEGLARYKDAIERVEVNGFFMRSEVNTLTVDTPSLTLALARGTAVDAMAKDSWLTVGIVPALEAGQVRDVPFAFARGGESAFNLAISDLDQGFSLKSVGSFVFDTAQDKRLPQGELTLRVILQVTVYVKPQGLF